MSRTSGLALATERTTETPAKVLARLGAVAAGWRRLADLELAGRTMVTFMKGHMAEIGRTMPYIAYFRVHYSDMAAEFVQADDDGFVTHHCARTLFGVWQEELELLAAGALGNALASCQRSLLTREPAVRPGRQPLAASWWSDVAAAVDAETPQLPELDGNSLLTREACVLWERPELFWTQFLLWSTQTWARQVVVMWQVLQETIALRRMIEERLDAVAVAGMVASTPDAYRTAADYVNSAYTEWRRLHAENVDIHDSIPRNEIYGAIGRWLTELGSVTATWTIKVPMKTEMYREVAVGVAALRGRPLTPKVPPYRYWRHTPWTPDCLREGAPGLPPFLCEPAAQVR